MESELSSTMSTFVQLQNLANWLSRKWLSFEEAEYRRWGLENESLNIEKESLDKYCNEQNLYTLD